MGYNSANLSNSILDIALFVIFKDGGGGGGLCLGARPSYSIVVDQDVKRPTNQPNKVIINIVKIISYFVIQRYLILDILELICLGTETSRVRACVTSCKTNRGSNSSFNRTMFLFGVFFNGPMEKLKLLRGVGNQTIISTLLTFIGLS